ncbi:ParB/RepB/Spo0J family partition protein [Streptomyces sparsogenes]|uniref:ParB/RepB/Spo0J family partition protein n=1 Tax=Streptomyces sparsogenes TaxID=67365 RepID=UPI0033F5A8C0
MSSKASQLGAGASFGQARPVSARRAAISAATAVRTEGVPDPTELPVDVISQNPDNPRDHLRDLDGLTQSIQELGVINAITVASVDAYVRERPDRAADLDEGAKWLVVDGHRRLEGARRAGLKTIKVHVDDARVATDQTLLEAAFVANFHRDDMTDLEQAHALESVVKFYGSQTKAAQRLGISQATISSKLSLLKLSPDLQAELASGERQVEHVRNLGKLDPEQQRAAADARAAATKKRNERRSAKATEAGDSPKPSGDYHAVISEDAERTRTQASVKDAAGTASQPTAAPEAVAAELPSQPGSHKGTPETAHTDRVDAMPWSDVQALALLIRDRMTPADQSQLLHLLQKHIQEQETHV